MNDPLHSILIIAVMAVVTALLRCLPFFIFSGKRSTSPFVAYLGAYLPYAMMGMLLIYCFKGVSFSAAPFGAPELLAGLVGGHAHEGGAVLGAPRGIAGHLAVGHQTLVGVRGRVGEGV